MNFGEKLQELLEKRGLSKSQLATVLNVSEEKVDNWLSGIELPSAEEAVRLSNLLNVSLDELLKTNYKKEEVVTLKEPLFTYDTVVDDNSVSRADYLKITKYDTLFRSVAALIAIGVFLIYYIITGATLLWIIASMVLIVYFSRNFRPKLEKLKVLKKRINGSVAKYSYFFYDDQFKVLIDQKGIINSYECYYTDLLKVIETDNIYSVMKNTVSFTIEKNKISESNKKWLEDKLHSVTKEYIVKAKNKKKKLSKDEYVGFGYLTITFIVLSLPVVFGMIKNFLHIKLLFILGLFLIIAIVFLFVCKRRGGKIKFSVLSIICGIFYIITCFSISTLSFAVQDLVITDKEYYTNIEDQIKIDLPDAKEIMIFDLESFMDEQIISEYGIKKFGMVQIVENKNFEDMLRNSSDIRWTNNPKSKQVFSQLPITIDESFINNNNYYSVYFIETDKFNKMPIIAGDYNAIFMLYNLESNSFVIMEFAIKVISSLGTGV